MNPVVAAQFESLHREDSLAVAPRMNKELRARQPERIRGRCLRDGGGGEQKERFESRK